MPVGVSVKLAQFNVQGFGQATGLPSASRRTELLMLTVFEMMHSPHFPPWHTIVPSPQRCWLSYETITRPHSVRRPSSAQGQVDSGTAPHTCCWVPLPSVDPTPFGVVDEQETATPIMTSTDMAASTLL